MKKVRDYGQNGPESTVDYYQSIISNVQERLRSKGILGILPELFINSLICISCFIFLQTDKLKN